MVQVKSYSQPWSKADHRDLDYRAADEDWEVRYL